MGINVKLARIAADRQVDRVAAGAGPPPGIAVPGQASRLEVVGEGQLGGHAQDERQASDGDAEVDGARVGAERPEGQSRHRGGPVPDRRSARMSNRPIWPWLPSTRRSAGIRSSSARKRAGGS